MMLVLVTFLGADHPPTANDRVRIGASRWLIGLASLAIPILCFTPTPLLIDDAQNAAVERSTPPIVQKMPAPKASDLSADVRRAATAGLAVDGMAVTAVETGCGEAVLCGAGAAAREAGFGWPVRFPVSILACRPLIDGTADAVPRAVGMSIPAVRLGGSIWLGECLFVIEVVVSRDVAGKLRPLEFGMEFANHAVLNHLAAARVDRVRDIGIELGPAVLVLDGPIFLEPQSALVAKAGLEVVFTAALRAMGGQFAARHGHKRAIRSFDDLQIPNDKAIVKGD